MKHRIWMAGIAAITITATTGCGSSGSKSSSATTGTGSSSTTGAPSNLPAQIKIGVPIDQSGTAAVASVGTSELKGVQLAAKQINDTHFLGSTQIVLDTYDTKADKQAAAAAALSIVSNKDSAALGFTLTPSFLAAAPALQQGQIPTVTLDASGSGVTEKGDYMFRIWPNLANVFPPNDVKVAQAVNAKTAAYLSQTDSSSIVEVAAGRKKALEAAGVKTVAEQGITATATDVRAQLTAIKGSNPDIIVISNPTGLTPLIYNAVQELGIKAQLLGASGVTDSNLKAAGAAMQCTILTEVWVPFSQQGNNQKFIDYWNSTNPGSAPDGFIASGYGGLWSIATAIKLAGSASGPDIQKSLSTMPNVSTPLGDVNYKNNRDAGVQGVQVLIQNSKEVAWTPTTTCTK